MDVRELAQQIEIRGYRIRIRRDEVLLESCLFCANPNYNLEVSASKGVYHCWACDASGTAASLLERIGATPPADLEVRWDPDQPSAGRGFGDVHQWPDGTIPANRRDSALAALLQRGLTEADAAWLGIGIQTKGPSAPRLVFPLEEYWSGSPVGYVSRRYGGLADGPKYLSAVEVSMSLAGWLPPGEPTTGRVHVIVEGVFDALHVRRAGFGAAMLLGVGRFDDARAWASRVDPDGRVVIMLDPEAENQARHLYWMLRSVSDHVTVAVPPVGRDPGSMDPDEIKKCVAQSRKPDRRIL